MGNLVFNSTHKQACVSLDGIEKRINYNCENIYIILNYNCILSMGFFSGNMIYVYRELNLNFLCVCVCVCVYSMWVCVCVCVCVFEGKK